MTNKLLKFPIDEFEDHRSVIMPDKREYVIPSRLYADIMEQIRQLFLEHGYEAKPEGITAMPDPKQKDLFEKEG